MKARKPAPAFALGLEEVVMQVHGSSRLAVFLMGASLLACGAPAGTNEDPAEQPLSSTAAAASAYQRGPDPTVTSNAATNGPFATAQVTVPSGNGFGGGFIYYPTDTSLGTWGAVAICPGFSAKFANEEAWMGPRLASFGFVVIGMETLTTSDSADSRGTELLAALDYLTQKSSVKDRVDSTRLAVMGHSAGGAGTLLAAVQRSSLKAAIGLAPGTPGTLNLSNNRVPTLVVSGATDSTVTPSYVDTLYAGLPASTPSAAVQLSGADHLYFTKANSNEIRQLIPWLKIFLDGDTRYTQFMCPTLKDTTGVSKSSAKCSLIPSATDGNVLTVVKTGGGTGTVSSAPSGISCGSTCSAGYASGTSVTLTATATGSSTFTGWSGACSGTSATCTVTMSAAQSVTASFTAGPFTSISINAGGPDSTGFVADTDFSGGSTYSNTSTIDTTLVSGVPQDVFQSERYGEFSYTVPGLASGKTYSVTLYFEESYLTAAGQRLFDVAINGTKVLTGFDIYSEAGGANKGVGKTFTATPDTSGHVTIQFTKGATENPKVCGLTVAVVSTPTCSSSPSAPANLSATAASTSQIQLAWSAVTPPTSCSVTYSVFRGGSQVATGLTTLSFTDTGLSPSTAYSYTVKAVDSAGSSASSNTATATTLTPPDTQAPSAPSGLSASNVTTTSLALSWNPSTDNVGVTSYDVYLGASRITSSFGPNATVSSLSPGTTYAFTVRALDGAGNVSQPSSALSVTTIPTSDLTPPSAPANLTWAADGLTVTLTWSPSTDDVGVVAYELFFGNFRLGSFTDTVLTLIGFKPATPYVFTVKARDAAGNVSVASNQITVLLGGGDEPSPPTAPTNLTATNVTSSSISLRWTASTDDVGVVVYQVLVGGSVAATVTTTSATISGLTAGTAYRITAVALDAAGDVSAPSAALSVTTAQ
jgi:chitodextrinase/dienelactone hydrolase